MNQSAFDRVMDAVEALHLRVGSLRQYDAKVECPMPDHDDGTPSLHVSDDPENGKVLLWCFGCGASYEDLAQAFALTVGDLFDVSGAPVRPAARAARLSAIEQRRGLRIANDAERQLWLESLPGYWRRRARELRAAGCELDADRCILHAELLGGLL